MYKAIEIEINALVTAKDYRRVLLALNFRNLMIFLLASPILLIVLIIGCLSHQLLYTEKIDETTIFGIVIYSFVGVLLTIAFMLGRTFFKIRTRANAMARVSEPTRIIFSDAGYRTFAKSWTMQTAWEKLQRVRELNEYFVFHLQDKFEEDFLSNSQNNMFYVFPKNCFQNSLQITAFKQLIREKLEGKARLKN